MQAVGVYTYICQASIFIWKIGWGPQSSGLILCSYLGVHRQILELLYITYISVSKTFVGETMCFIFMDSYKN